MNVSYSNFIPAAPATVPVAISIRVVSGGTPNSGPFPGPVTVTANNGSGEPWGTLTCDGHTGKKLVFYRNPASCQINSTGGQPPSGWLDFSGTYDGTDLYGDGVPYVPPLTTIYEFPKRLPPGSFMAVSFNYQTYVDDIAVSEGPLPIIAFVKDGTNFDFRIPSGNSPGLITPCSLRGGEFCFAEQGAIGVISSTGAITEIPTPTAGAVIGGMVEGPEGNLWFTEPFAGKIGILGVNAIHEWPTRIPGSRITGISIVYPDYWDSSHFFTFTDPGTNSIGWFNPPPDPGAPQLHEDPVPTAGGAPSAIFMNYYAESKAPETGSFWPGTCYVCAPSDIQSNGIIESMGTDGQGCVWALTASDILEIVNLGSPLLTKTVYYKTPRSLAAGTGQAFFLAAGPVGTAVVEIQNSQFSCTEH